MYINISLFTEANVVATDLRLLKRLKHVAAKPIRLDRLALPVMSILLCIAVVIYTEMTQTDFATYLLYTFIANVLGAVLYYVVLMKVNKHGDSFDRFFLVGLNISMLSCTASQRRI